MVLGLDDLVLSLDDIVLRLDDSAFGGGGGDLGKGWIPKCRQLQRLLQYPILDLQPHISCILITPALGLDHFGQCRPVLGLGDVLADLGLGQQELAVGSF